jgi:hypothetical protein
MIKQNLHNGKNLLITFKTIISSDNYQVFYVTPLQSAQKGQTQLIDLLKG